MTGLGWGEFEGQCTEDGKTCGMGMWKMNELSNDNDEWKGLSLIGFFKDDLSQGYIEAFYPANGIV